MNSHGSNYRMKEVMSELENKIEREVVRQLEEYFRGKRKEFELPLDITGTPFEISVWRELMKIPYGETVTYSDIACRIGRENAVRAVANAIGRNPLHIIIPCHRVTAKNGLGGFKAGIKNKIYLLELEKRFTIDSCPQKKSSF